MRIDAMRATTQAASGHPTSCLSAADMVAALFFYALRYDYKNPKNPKNDRFILSKGHAIPIVYAALHQLGVITEELLLSLRDFDSPLEGHPTPRFAYNEAATGSLGQGLAIGLGMALNAKHDNLPYRTFVMMGDGELAEGSVWEAAELASHAKADNLIGLVDANRLGQSDEALHAHHVQRYAQKFEAFGFKTWVIDGHNMQAIVDALTQAMATTGQPSMIIAKTFKGYGLEGVQDSPGFHGKPFSKDELPTRIAELKTRFAAAAAYKPAGTFAPPQPASATLKKMAEPVIDITKDQRASEFTVGAKLSTRKAFGYALQALGKASEAVFTLDADVKNSTYTEFFAKQFPDRFIQCFIAEQNMVGVSTGLALRGKIPFAATFACFLTRAHDQIRMAGIGRVPLRLSGSHVGVSIGQDGPSQMGLEDIGMMRSIPDSVVLWPSDGVSAYKLVGQMAGYDQGISYMKTTRADTPVLYAPHVTFPIGGCKILRSSDADRACIITAGITVHEALAAYEMLKKQGILVAVVDLYSIKPLDEKTIRQVAVAVGKKVVTVEDHYPEGGLGEAVAATLVGEQVCLRRLAVTQIPHSGSPERLLAWAGINADGIVQAVKALL
jgi:transketolase